MTAPIRLGELVSILGGGTPDRDRTDYYNGDIPWVTVKDLKDELTISSSQERITRLGLENSASRLVPAGSVIVATRMAVGKAVRTLTDVAINQDLKAVVSGQRIDTGFLLFFLRSKASFLESRASGSTVKGILIEDLQELEVALPLLSEQQRIAKQLEEADRLVRTRRYALELIDAILPAAFLELFGDPVSNEKGWPGHELEELATVERGKFTPRPRNDPSYYGGTFPFIQTGDISNSEGRLHSWTQTLNEKGVKVSRCFPPGTVVIAIVGATIGVTAILEVEVYCPDSVVGIQVDPKAATKEYIEFLLRFWRPVFLAQAPETARANINLDTLRPLRIPVPPLPLQQKFSALVERVEAARAVQREALRQAEHLFASLLECSFKGR